MLAEDWEEYEKTVNRNTDSVEFTKFNIQLYKSLKLMTAGRYKAAINIFDDIIAEMPLDVSHIRYTLVVLEYKAEAYSKMGNYAKAVDCMLRMESLSKSLRLRMHILRFTAFLPDTTSNSVSWTRWKSAIRSISA